MATSFDPARVVLLSLKNIFHSNFMLLWAQYGHTRATNLLSSNPMKRISSLLIFSSLILTACFGGSSCDTTVQAEGISLCIPADWEQVPEEQLRAEGVPEETVAAFQLNTQREGHRDNIVVTKERIAASVTPMKYATASIRVVAKTPEYNEIEQREIEAGGKKTILHIFTARPVPNFPVRRFYQVSVVKGTTGYIVTGTLPLSVDEDVEKGLVEMMEGVSLSKS